MFPWLHLAFFVVEFVFFSLPVCEVRNDPVGRGQAKVVEVERCALRHAPEVHCDDVTG